MLQGAKLELLEKINSLNSNARSGKQDLPEQICDFLIESFDLQASVLFKIVNEQTIVVYGKSSNAKKNFLKGSTFNFNISKVFELSSDFAVNTDSNNELQISEFVIYEAGILFKINNQDKGFLKIARENPFTQADVKSLKNICALIGNLINSWLATQGGGTVLSEKPFSDNIYEISQQLRSPANTIIGFTSILSEDNLTTSQAEYANTIKKNAQCLLVTINDLAELSKIESGNISENIVETDLSKLLNETFEAISNKLNNPKLDLHYSIDKNISSNIKVDAQKLKQIINNLLTFSGQLTEEGKINLIIKADGTDKLQVTVGDTGAGIPAEHLKDIFSPFSIFKLSQFKSCSISGLIMPITQRLVKILGGELNIDSMLGKGTSINFKINCEITNGSTEKKVSTTLESLPKPSPDLNKILVIEDDYASSKLLSNYLNKWGYDPTIVNTEEQTLSLINKEKFLAIIMDINLPNTNGLELLRKIHNHPNSKNTPVIVCSVEAEQQKAYLMGAVEYFQKPINYNFLVEVLTNYKLRKNSNILCVDDDLPTLNLVKQAIETAGFNAVDENVSANVMELIKDKDIDLAIVDLDMPQPNGFELIKLIKSEPKFTNLPIIIYTGKDNFADDLKQIDGLFEELLDKRSVNIEDLAGTINSMVHKIETPPTVEEVIEKKDVIKILFAEDYKHSQIIVTRLLKKNNFENVAVVENGKEAHDLAVKEKFDLILMDMQMPIMNGFEATSKIREMDGYKDVPIIALTAFAMKGDREKCLDAGATDYIPKPIDSKEFIEKVRYYTNTLK